MKIGVMRNQTWQPFAILLPKKKKITTARAIGHLRHPTSASADGSGHQQHAQTHSFGCLHKNFRAEI
jgi:hypothetical protein